jgi:hypothetical protein
MKTLTNFLRTFIFFIYEFIFRFLNRKSSNNFPVLKNNNSCEELFNKIFHGLNNFKFIKSLLQVSLHQFNKNPKEILFYHFYRYYKKRHSKFSPTFIFYESSEIIFKKIISNQKFTIILATHDGFAFATKLISDEKDVYVLHGGRTGNTLKNTFKLSCINKDVQVVQADKYCFAKMLEKSYQDLIFVCCIDERSKETRKYDVINPNIFRFIRKFKIPVFFYQNTIDNYGRIVIDFYEPLSIDSSTKLGNEFLEFLWNGNCYSFKKNDF